MRRILAALPLATLGPLAQAQNIDQSMSTNNPPPPIVSRSQQALARDANSTTWQVLEQTFYPATGAVISRTNQYVELGAGLNYLSDPAAGQWAPSEDLIQLMPDGSAAALKGPAKLYLKPNLNSPGAVTIVAADGTVFQTQPIGLFWYDPASGNASLIAQAQGCAGELEPPNQVVYRGAFGAVADLRLTYTKGAIESDLVLLQCPQLPPGFDAATARLELWHACQPLSAPNITPHTVGPQGATDDVLDFGSLWFPTGAAYWSDGSGARAADTPAAVRVPTLTEDGTLAPVCKTWLAGGAEDVLVEAVAWNAVAAKLASLPPTAPADLPAPAQDRSSWLAELEAPPGTLSAPPAVIGQGGGYQPVGLVWDYITLTGSYVSYTFATGQTYYVSNNVSFSGNVVFNPCVIKFSSGAYILASGSITCNGSSSSPTIFTSWQDDIFGNPISPPNPCPSSYMASEALWAYYINGNVSVSGLRFRWASTALRFDPGSCCNTYELVSNCSFEFCGVGICANCCSVTISGSTMCSVGTPTQALNECASFTGGLTDVCSPGLDSDGNGVPDLYEYRYFGRLGTLPGNLLGQLSNMTNTFSPGGVQNGVVWSGSQPIWSTLDHTTPQYVYNTGCWLYGARGVQDQSVGISALSPWNDGNTQNPQWGGGTLITKRHAIFSGEWGLPNPGVHVRFIGKDGSCNTATVVAGAYVDVNQYSMVVLFEQDLPGTVAYVKVLPDVSHYLLPTMQNSLGCTNEFYVQCVRTDQNEWAYINDLYSLQGGLGSLIHSQWFPNWKSYFYYYKQPRYCCCQPVPCVCEGQDASSNDGGHPVFLLINGELVLIGPNYWCDSCPWPGYSCDQIDSAIAGLGGSASGYRVTRYDPAASGFPSLW